MTQVPAVVDGITIQHAGELLLEHPGTAETRQKAPETYIRCLEDLAFAVMFADKIAVTGKLERVGRQMPGESLMRYLEDLRDPLDQVATLRPSEALQEPWFRDWIRADLLIVEESLSAQQSVVWRDFIIREAVSYLGDHPSLRSNASPAADYRFGKTEPNYFSDPDLQETLSADALNSLLPPIRTALPRTRASASALREFIRRVILTHMTIFRWYDWTAAETYSMEHVRLPYVTRADVQLRTIRDLGELALQEFRNLLVPHALMAALETKPSRRDVIPRLLALREDRAFRELRLLLSDAVHACGQRDSRELTRLGEAVRRFRTSTVGDEVTLSNGFVSVKLRSAARTLERMLDKHSYWLRHVLVTRSSSEDYFRELRRVFPELFEGKS